MEKFEEVISTLEDSQHYHEKRCAEWSGYGLEDYPNECNCITSEIIELIKETFGSSREGN